jgi:hypothetical protein
MGECFNKATKQKVNIFRQSTQIVMIIIYIWMAFLYFRMAILDQNLWCPFTYVKPIDRSHLV